MRVSTVDHAAVHDWYATYNARDIDGMCRLADPEIVVGPRLTKLPGATFHGHTGVRALMGWAFDTYPRARSEAFSVRDEAGLVLATTRFVVQDRAPSVITVDKYTLFDGIGGKLRRVSTYSSETAALAAAARRCVLTPREREVFQLVAHGRTVQEIADVLFLSPATVRTHVRNGIARLGATNRVHAVSLALKHGEILA